MANKLKAKKRDEELLDQEIDGEGGSFSMEEFLLGNRNLLLVGVGVIVLLIGGLAFYNSMNNQKNTEANSEMFKAVKYFEADSFNMAMNGDGQYLGFLDIAEDYSGTGAANQANYYLGIIYYKQGDLESSREYLEKVSTGDDLLSMSTYMALGFVYEDLGERGKAASNFEKAANTPAENESTSPLMLLNAGRNYEADGNLSKALSLYQKIKDKYPQSAEARDIDKYIGRVSK